MKTWTTYAATLTLVSVLVSCSTVTTCYGIEPDGERETLQPCPEGWSNGTERRIEEDEFADLEVDTQTGRSKKTTKTTTTSTTPPARKKSL